MKHSVRCARACAWLLMVAACVGACSDTFVVGREDPRAGCSSCQARLDCQDVESCPPLCPWAEEPWQSYDGCVCQECEGKCGGCPASELFVTDIACTSCPAQVAAVGGACRNAWLTCSES